MNRRQLIKLGGLAGVGALTLGTTSCSPKNLSIYVQTVVGALKEISPLLPSSAQLIAKAVSIAETFDKAYRDGKFENATSLFENLVGVVSQIMSDVGIDNPTVKVALAVAGIALRAIAVLLASQSSQPAVAEAIQKHGAAGKARVTLIEKLADPAAIEKAYQASKLR